MNLTLLSAYRMLAALLSLPRRVLMLLVRFYRFFISPALGASCRYEPSCSSYALQALDRHGAAAGTYLAMRRLVRCHPFCDGGDDPVPDHPPQLFRRLIPGAGPHSGSLLSTSIDKTPS